jgi:hypothetical protein
VPTAPGGWADPDVGYEGLDWQVGRALTCAGGDDFGNDDAEQDGEGGDAMDHLQGDLAGGDGLQVVDLRALGVVPGNGLRRGGRPEFPVGQREVGNGEPGMLVARDHAGLMKALCIVDIGPEISDAGKDYSAFSRWFSILKHSRPECLIQTLEDFS